MSKMRVLQIAVVAVALHVVVFSGLAFLAWKLLDPQVAKWVLPAVLMPLFITIVVILNKLFGP
jgi:hypothetical protein